MRTMTTPQRASIAHALLLLLFLFSRAEGIEKNTTTVEHKEGDVTDDGSVLGARGGTELMADALMDCLPSFLLDRFQIVSSRVRQLDPNKKQILWIHDLPDDPENQHLAFPESRHRFHKIVFVSEWQRQEFAQHFQYDFADAVVVKNAIAPLPVEPKDRQGPIRLIYHTTPHRGLQILLPVFIWLYEALGEDSIVLDVYSSFKIYGWEFRDEPYLKLFDTCRQHPGCHYHGTVSNEEVRQALLKAHIFAYPSIWPETSCIAAIEALSAGCEIVTSSLGALPETVGGFATMYNFTSDKKDHAQIFARHLQQAIATFWDQDKVKKRRLQQIAAAQTYDWGFLGLGGRGEFWTQGLAMMEPDLNGMATPQRESFDSQAKYVEALIVAGRMAELRRDLQRAVALYERIESLDKNNAHWLIAYGNLLMMKGNVVTSSLFKKGAELVEYAMTNDDVRPPIQRDSAVLIEMGAKLAFSYDTLYNYERSSYWLDEMVASKYPHDDSWQVFRATQVPHHPGSPQEEIQNIQTYHQNMDVLLSRDDLVCSDGNAFGSVFPLAYYDLDYREELAKYTQLLTKAFPWLNYEAPDLTYDDEAAVDIRCAQGKIKIGAVSSFFTPESSIWGSFGTTIRALQAHPMIDLAMIYYPRQGVRPEDHQNLSMNPQTNIYLDPQSKANPQALLRNREKIAQAKFDVVLYLDLFMTVEMHQLAVAKLAPVQVCTHGHPVTSGVRREIMDYYLSWELAELPEKKDAQRFYTEELVLVPGNVTWEYYEPRSTPQERSIITAGNPSFAHYTRHNLDFIPVQSNKELLLRPNAVWYFCSAASFKFHIEFDKVLGRIQQLDPNAVIILIQQLDGLDRLYQMARKRFIELGTVDLDRVVFIPRLPHDKLMAMYKLSDVVLDPFYFGGDTTTREAFEVGAPIITLPHKTIGQRWTQAYYRRMGITDFIAKDPEDYAQLAVKCGNQADSEKKKTRKRIKDAANSKLFRRQEGFLEWAKALIDVARRPRRWHWHDADRAPLNEVQMRSLPNIDKQQHTEL